MSPDSVVVDQVTAQTLFDALPLRMQWPTLSPDYVVADAARDPLVKPVFLVCQQEGGLLMHAVHESRIAGGDSCDWQSAYGYGGPIVVGLDGDSLARAWHLLDAAAAARRVVVEFVRFHPGLENHRFYPGTIRDDRVVVAINLTVDDLFLGYSGRARTAIRKAEHSDLQAVWETPDDALAHFPTFYLRCMREIGAGAFYLFSDLYFEHVLCLPGARVLSIRRGDERISMGLFLFGPKQVEYHLSGTLQASRKSGATNLLLHAAARTAQSSGCLTLYLGGGTSAREDDPLLRFKESYAEPRQVFRIGHRIHDPAAYARLREAEPELAASSERVLFYRR